MSIELEPAKIRQAVESELAPRLVEWTGGYVSRDVAAKLSNMITESLYETAAITAARGAQSGILAGLAMIRSWQDDG